MVVKPVKRVRQISRVMGARLHRHVLLGLSGAVVSGCAFFGAEYDPCFDAGECSEPDDDESDDDGVGGSWGDGDGDGDLWKNGGSGGGGSGAGGDGSGGASGGGSGGFGTGGDGSGGDGSGGGVGSGGDAGSGGDGSGGGGSVLDDLQRYLTINEIGHAGLSLIELYNAGPSSIDLSSIAVTGDLGDYVNLCLLSGTLAPGEVFLAQDSSGDCHNGVSTCRKGCSFNIGGGEVVAVYYGEGGSGPWELVDSQVFPSSPMLPSPGRTYQAVEDGSDTFSSAVQTAGLLNVP